MKKQGSRWTFELTPGHKSLKSSPLRSKRFASVEFRPGAQSSAQSLILPSAHPKSYRDEK